MIAGFSLDLPTVSGIFGLAVVGSAAASLFLVKGIRGALEASQESVATLLAARQVAKDDLVAERARWELKVDALEVKIVTLEQTVEQLRGAVVVELLDAAKLAFDGNEEFQKYVHERFHDVAQHLSVLKGTAMTKFNKEVKSAKRQRAVTKKPRPRRT